MHELTLYEPKNWASFADRVVDLLHEQEIVREGLVHEGPAIMTRLCINGPLALREVSRRTGLSPTYLSLVLNGKSVISADAYILLCDCERKMHGLVGIYGSARSCPNL